MIKMSKNFNEKKYLVVGAIFVIGLFLWPFSVKAATTVYFDLETPVIYEGDTFLVNLKISTPDKPINVVDGTILYDNNKLEVKEVSTGNSLFALWPKPPAFSNDKGTLSFVGGVQDGFQGKEGEVLKIIFLAKNEGEAQIDFLDGFSVFLHDGKGTQINPWLRPLLLSILTRPPETPAKDEWQDLLEKDKTPPEFIEAIVSQDSHIFGNQYFVSFFATDKESGIDHYEVQEGTSPYIIGDSPYLLKDQKLRSTIRVKAIDKAGNEKIEELMPPIPPVPFYKNVLVGIVVVLIVVLLILYILWRIFRRGSKFQKNEKP